MNKRTSIAASVLGQARKRQQLIPDTASAIGGPGNPLHSRVENSSHPETGVPQLRVIIPGQRQPEIYDFSRLLIQPKLAALLAEGFRRWSTEVSTGSRKQNQRHLNNSLASFLETYIHIINPKEINEVFWTSLIHWLNSPKRNNQPWALGTRADILSAFSICISALEEHTEYGETAAYLLNRSGFPHNPWPGRHRKVEPTNVLTPFEKDQLVQACLKEVGHIQQRLNDREIALARGKDILASVRSTGAPIPYSDARVCAAIILEAFPNRLPSLNDLFSLDYRLGRAVQFTHSISKIRDILHNAPRDLVPFVLLLGIRTAFNPTA